MHSAIALNRIQAQLNRPSSVQVAYDAIQEVSLSPPISLEELRAVLMEEMNKGVVQTEALKCDAPTTDLYFNNIYDFCEWYTGFRDKFNEQQQTALDTLTQVRAGIDNGCACKRAFRERMAHDYFSVFWTNNAKTDLLETIAKITGAPRVSVNQFCVYPPTN